ncbi:hypothetical protein LEN26_018019 [Aphanomyces euteiches]|nr:hypothetical protein LEN26_018019 [Aphanomyces euteiches]
MRPRVAFWTTRWTVQHIRNGLTVFALIYVIIRGLSTPSSPFTVAQGAPPPLSPQDTAFAVACSSIYGLSRNPQICYFDHVFKCQMLCQRLVHSLGYYVTNWPSTLAPACDAACNVRQSSICDSGASFLQFCEDVARARAQAASPLVVAQDDQSCQSFFSFVLLFIASNVLVFVTESKAKDPVASHDDADLYEASRSDVTTSLISHLMLMNNAILAVFGELDKNERAVKGKELVDVTLPTMFRLLEHRLVMTSVGDPYLLEKLSLADLEVYLTVDMLKTNFLRDIDTSTIPDGYTHVMRIYNAVKEHP